MKLPALAVAIVLIVLIVHPSVRPAPRAQTSTPVMLTPNASGELAAIGNTLYFAAQTPETGYELWKSDGTVAGTVLIKDIHDNDNECMKDSLPQNFVSLGNGVVLFTAITGDEPCGFSYGEGEELWRTDGTEAGTWMVKDINPGVAGGFDVNHRDALVSLGGLVLFVADDGTYGRELWASDGTLGGTVMLKDIQAGSAWGDPQGFTLYNGRLYFVATNGTGYELWASDGTPDGTMLVRDINPSGGSNPRDLVVAGGWLYFSANDGTAGPALWRTDGTAANTTLVVDLVEGTNASLGPSSFAAIGGEIVFSSFYTVGQTTYGPELFISDGTGLGTRLIRDIRPGLSSSNPTPLGVLGDVFLFRANDGVAGAELWRTDGTEAGTWMVVDLTAVGGTDFTSPRVLRDYLYFVTDQPSIGLELWRSDGTAAGTRNVLDLAPGVEDGFPSELTLIGDLLFFSTANFAGSLPHRSLWVLDIGEGQSEADAPIVTPVVTGTLGENGWYVSDVSVSWSIDDQGSPVSGSSGCGPSAVTVDTVAVTFTCSATNAGGTTSEAVTIKRDTVAPVSTPSTTPSVNPNGWYRTDVVVFWTGTDATSGIASCATSEVMMAEGAGQSSGVGTCTDNAGLVSEGTQLVGINIDKTAPDLPTVTPSSSNNANGWYNTDVTATWTGTDALSGIAFCTAPQTISSEGAGQSTVLGRCTDLAGNVSDGIQIVGINIDKTPPTVSAKVPASGSVVPRRSLILVSYSCADTLSGIDPGGCEGTQPNGSPLDTRKRVKRAVFVIAATDLAGNTTTEIVRYEISPKEESR